MIYRDEFAPFDKECKSIIGARRAGILIIMGVISLGYVAKEVLAVLSNNPHFENYLYLTVLVGTVCFIGGWVWISGEELDQLLSWMDPRGYAPPQGLKEAFLIAGQAVLLAALLAAAKQVVVFALVLTGVYAIALIGTLHLLNELRRAFTACDRYLAEERTGSSTLAGRAAAYSAGLRALRQYHLGRPHRLKHWLLVLSGLAVVVVALVGKYLWPSQPSVPGYLAALVVVGGDQLVTSAWRAGRDKQLREAEILRAEAERKWKEHERAGGRADAAT